MTPASKYKICTRCVMDQSDPGIAFNSDGVCDYCENYDQNILPDWERALRSDDAIREMAKKIKLDGASRDFDCIIGISGGLDSSYAAYIAKERMGLRPLLFHVDAGWNTGQAVSNIEKLVDGLDLQLHTEVIPWDEMQRLQLAFLRSGVSDQDLPQDAAFFSSLYKYARKKGIRHVLTGSNFSTECCREPEEWGGYLGIDKRLFADIINKFSDAKLHSFPLVDIMVYKIWYQKILGMKVHHPLNLIKFSKNEAEAELNSKYGWLPFKHKHHESRFTRFYEDYWLPRRFGFDKRRAHFSSLIMTGQMTREQALSRLNSSELGEFFHTREFQYVANKLNIGIDELRGLFNCPKKSYKDYKNKRWLISLGGKVMRALGLERRFFR